MVLTVRHISRYTINASYFFIINVNVTAILKYRYELNSLNPDSLENTWNSPDVMS